MERGEGVVERMMQQNHREERYHREKCGVLCRGQVGRQTDRNHPRSLERERE